MHRYDPRVLELSADLRLLDEPPDQLGMVAVLIAHHLDGQVAAEVEVAALEDGPHASARQLAHELISRGWVGMPVTLNRSGPDQRSVIGRLAQMDARRRRAERSSALNVRSRSNRVRHEGGTEAKEAPGAEPRRGVSRCASTHGRG